MRGYVGRIGYRGYRTSRSNVLPSTSPARSFAHVNARLAIIRELPVRVEQILFRIDFGISAGAPETNEARDEKTRQEEKGIKKGGHVQR